MSLVVSKAALALKCSENVPIVKFESHKSKKKKNVENENVALSTERHNQKEMDLKKIRHEIVRFGMSGFDAKKKEEAKIALAVSLGAKPPKRPYINYKELMAKRKEDKQKLKEQQEIMRSKINVTVGIKKKKKGANNDVGHLLSGYGKVQKKDIKKLETKGMGKKKNK